MTRLQRWKQFAEQCRRCDEGSILGYKADIALLVNKWDETHGNIPCDYSSTGFLDRDHYEHALANAAEQIYRREWCIANAPASYLDDYENHIRKSPDAELLLATAYKACGLEKEAIA
jgi:hypothetical protein